MSAKTYKLISCRNGINLICFLGCASVFAILEFGNIPPRKNGFFCNDQSIRYPFIEETVSDVMLIGLTVVLGICFIFVFELVIAVNKQIVTRSDKRSDNSSSEHGLHIKEEASPSFYNFDHLSGMIALCGRKAAVTTIIFLWYNICNGIITDVVKITTGSLRPHFFAVCNPNFLCTLKEEYLDQTNYFCQDSSPSEQNSARKSFPSGHASTATTSMVFLIVYFQRRCKHMDELVPNFLKLTMSLCLFSLAMWISMTRVSDHHHHLIDVLTGIVLGGSIGFVGGVHSTTINLTNEDEKINLRTENFEADNSRSKSNHHCFKNEAFHNEEIAQK